MSQKQLSAFVHLGSSAQPPPPPQTSALGIMIEERNMGFLLMDNGDSSILGTL